MFICRWYNWIEGGPMMWMSSTMDGNRQEGKWLIIECKALKWVKPNNAPPPQGSLWRVSMVDGMIMTSSSRLQWLYIKKYLNA
jgi:hypothetical protein